MFASYTVEPTRVRRAITDSAMNPKKAPGAQTHQGGADSAGQSGDTQGLSQTADASEETVEELADDGQDYEAGIQTGVENASDRPERPVPSHEGQERRETAAPGRGPA
jgi:hypothetical protein